MSSSDRVLQVMEQLSRQNPFSGSANLTDPLRPDEKNIPSDLPPAERLPHVQRQIDLLCYNRLPQTFFNLEKHRPLRSILMTGKETLREALPIRCLEATFVALYLTQGMKDVVRIPLSFRTQVKGTLYQHIVLVVHVRHPTPRFGALGLSRKRSLMYKPLTFAALFDLVLDYKQAYQRLGHRLLDIKLGLAVPHDADLTPLICWRFVALRFTRFDGRAGRASLEAPPTAAGRPSYSLGLSSFSGGGGGAAVAATPGGGSRGNHPTGSGEAAWEPPPEAVAAPASPSSVSEVHRSEKDPDSTASSSIRLQSQEEEGTSPVEPNHERCPSGEVLDPVAQSSIEEDHVNYQSLGVFLARYSHLLPTMSKQYSKAHHRDLCGETSKVFFSSLEMLEDPKSENQRRIECIERMRSPLDLSVMKAATHQKPLKEKVRGKK